MIRATVEKPIITETASIRSKTTKLVNSLVINHIAISGEEPSFHYGLLPTHQKERLEGILDGIARGRGVNLNFKGSTLDAEGRSVMANFIGLVLREPADPNHRETVLQHSNAILGMALDLQQRSINKAARAQEEGKPYTGLAHVIDFITVASTVPLHDIEEGWEGGDLPRNLGPLYHVLRGDYQQGGRSFIEITVLPGFDNDQQRNWFLELYERYEEKLPSDPEAQLINLLDKLQCILFITQRKVPNPFEAGLLGLEAGLEARDRLIKKFDEIGALDAKVELDEYMQELLSQLDPYLVQTAEEHVASQKLSDDSNIIGLSSERRRKLDGATHHISETIITSPEIERKWLPNVSNGILEELQKYPSTEITQWHFVRKNGTEIRLRQEGDRYFLTQLSGDTVQKVPIEIEVVNGERDALLREVATDAAAMQVRKTRYHVATIQNIPLFLDIYHDHLEGLALFEAKFETKQQADGFLLNGDYGTEVTNNSGYSSSELALYGIPSPENKATAIEREIKLVIENPIDIAKLEAHKYLSHEIWQGYLNIGSNGTEERIRRDDERYFYTTKSGERSSRKHIEKEITEGEFADLRGKVGDRTVSKTRYEIPLELDYELPSGKKTVKIELDLYEGKLSGLQTMEIEFDSEIDLNYFRNHLPTWMTPLYGVNDVTADQKFKNQQLALHGIPSISA